MVERKIKCFLIFPYTPARPFRFNFSQFGFNFPQKSANLPGISGHVHM